MRRAFTPQHCYEMWERVKRHPDCQRKRCVYAEVIRADLTEPYISICVKDPSDNCRVGFRCAEPLRIASYHVADLGLAVVKCGKAELWIEPVECSGVLNYVIESYSGPTSIAIRVWWNECLRITFDDKSYCICPLSAMHFILD